jgi:hypothetical protein
MRAVRRDRRVAPGNQVDPPAELIAMTVPKPRRRLSIRRSKATTVLNPTGLHSSYGHHDAFGREPVPLRA